MHDEQTRTFLASPPFPWQQGWWQQFIEQKKTHQFPQALLIVGPRDNGLSELAIQLAAFLLCTAEGRGPCGLCRDCVLFQAGSHPDYFHLHPEEKSKTIKVDAIRELIPKLSQTAQRQGRQIVVMDPADAMNIAAANALLKTLEEPPGDVVFVLVASEVSRLPATIISRCRVMTAGLPEAVMAEAWLSQRAEQASVLLRLADYLPLRALHFFEHQVLALRAQIFKHVLALLEGSGSVVSVAEAWAEQDRDMLFQILFTLCLDVLAIQQGAAPQACVHQDQLALLQSLATRLSAQVIWNFLKALETWRDYQLRSLNVNPELLLTVALFGLKK